MKPIFLFFFAFLLHAMAGPVERREEALRAKDPETLPRLEELARDESPLVRRAAIRSLGTLGEPARALLEKAFAEDADALARRTALRLLAPRSSGEALQKLLEKAARDPGELVRIAAVEETGRAPEPPQWCIALLERAKEDDSPRVRNLASRRLWPYQAPVASARELPEFQDIHLNTAKTEPLPLAGWRFATDPAQSGHLHQWQKPGFDDSGWSPIHIGKPWQEFGHAYEGVAWYRLRFTLPEKPNFAAVDLVFEAVDESVWVWLNGEFVGAHDVGAGGWNQRFAIHAAPHLQWNGENQLAVRVAKRKGTHAGIWKPVFLEILTR